MLNDLIPKFVNVVDNADFKRMGSPFTFHLADTLQTNISVKDVIEVDIKSAFPTICKLMYGESSQFVQNIFKHENKFERNKYIAITLKQQGQKDGVSYLSDLNLWSKILIMGYIYSKFKDIVVLQYVKDGVYFTGQLNDSINNDKNFILNYIQQNNIIFHENNVEQFIRFNKTTIIKDKHGLSIKGMYHSLPLYLQETVLPKILSGEIYDYSFLDNIKYIYSNPYGKIIKYAALTSYLENYYKINGKFLNSVGMHDTIDNLEPRSYLRYIVFPVLALCRITQIHN